MAVAFDAGSEAEGSGTGFSWSHTTAGSDRALYTGVGHTPGDSEPDAVSATYNSVAMDVLFTDVTTHSSRRTRVFRLVAPATGTNSIAFSWSGGSTFRGIGASFTGVDQSDPDDAHVTQDGGGGGTSSSLAVTSGATDDMAVGILVTAAGVTSLSTTDTEINQMSGGSTNTVAMSYQAGAASVTMDWSWTGFAAFVAWAFNVNASGAAAASILPLIACDMANISGMKGMRG